MNQTVVLFDDYGMESQNLHTSLLLSGYDYPVVVIEDDGFLPEEVDSIYSMYLGDYAKSSESFGKPRYFNQINVPDYWEISADNRSGKICDLHHTRGYIYYTEPENKRLVKRVDWCHENGVLRSSDHYNQYGILFARTIYNAKGKRTIKTYFDVNGKDVITENYITGDIMLENNGKLFVFRSKTELVIKYFMDRGWGDCRLLYNSLSTPFFVSERLPENGMQDILFWQEPARPDIPGNMQIILDGNARRTKFIKVQKKLAYDQFVKLGVSTDYIEPLGFVYPFMKTNAHMKEALICTNSDQIAQLETLVKALPQIRFHVAALTEMSPKLMGMGRYENVKLYPVVREEVVERLFEQCDIYLDINYMNEIVNAVSEAFLYNHVIFAFTNTLHNRDYVAPEHIYTIDNVGAMIGKLTEIVSDYNAMEDCLFVQQRHAMAEVEYKL